MHEGEGGVFSQRRHLARRRRPRPVGSERVSNSLVNTDTSHSGAQKSGPHKDGLRRFCGETLVVVGETRALPPRLQMRLTVVNPVASAILGLPTSYLCIYLFYT